MQHILKHKKLIIAAATGITVAVAVLLFIVGAGTYHIPGIPGQRRSLLIKIGKLHRGDIALAQIEDSLYLAARVAARPGDTLDIQGGRVIVNGHPADEASTAISSFIISRESSYRILHEIEREAGPCGTGDTVRLHYTAIRTEWQRYLRAPMLRNIPDERIYPHIASLHWNAYNIEHFILPKKGMTVSLNSHNRMVYSLLIDPQSLANETYTFDRDYYFLLSDDRDDASDSRIYGPVSRPQLLGRLIIIKQHANE